MARTVPGHGRDRGAQRSTLAGEAVGVDVFGRLAADWGEQGGGGLDIGERVMPAQQAGEAERRGHASLVAEGRERVLAVVPFG